MRNLQKFESGQTETYSIFGGFYKLQVRGKRIKQIFLKKTKRARSARPTQASAGPAHYAMGWDT
jgi:hypothetical protein